MTTKAADEYSDISKRMKELGCTSDAPVRLDDEKPPEPVIGATVSGEDYLAALKQSQTIASFGQIMQNTETQRDYVCGIAADVILNAGERAADPPTIITYADIRSDMQVCGGSINWVDEKYDREIKEAMARHAKIDEQVSAYLSHFESAGFVTAAGYDKDQGYIWVHWNKGDYHNLTRFFPDENRDPVQHAKSLVRDALGMLARRAAEKAYSPAN